MSSGPIGRFLPILRLSQAPQRSSEPPPRPSQLSLRHSHFLPRSRTPLQTHPLPYQRPALLPFYKIPRRERGGYLTKTGGPQSQIGGTQKKLGGSQSQLGRARRKLGCLRGSWEALEAAGRASESLLFIYERYMTTAHIIERPLVIMLLR